MDDDQTQSIARHGRTTIAPGVLLNIARLAALGVPGVARMSPVPGGVNRLFKRGIGDGVRIEIRDQAVAVDLYLIVNHDASLHDTGRAVQTEVARSIREMVGMDILAVNVYVEDVAYPVAAPPAGG